MGLKGTKINHVVRTKFERGGLEIETLVGLIFDETVPVRVTLRDANFAENAVNFYLLVKLFDVYSANLRMLVKLFDVHSSNLSSISELIWFLCVCNCG